MAQLSALESYLSLASSDLRMSDLSYSLCARRMHHSHRVGMVVSTVSEAVSLLSRILSGREDSRYVSGVVESEHGVKRGALQRRGETLLAKESSAEDVAALHELAQLYCDGYSLPWWRMQQWEAVRHLDLPAYSFANTEHWITTIDAETTKEHQPLAESTQLILSVKQEKKLPMKEVISHLITHLASVLFTEPAAIDIDKPLSEMGLDSILAVEWLQRLKEALGVELLATVVYEYTTVTLLAEHIASLLNLSYQQDAKITSHAESTNAANIVPKRPSGKIQLSVLDTLNTPSKPS